MAQLNEDRYRGYQGVYPIIEYAHKIGKNTAELTTIDMVNFMKWWIKQPQRNDLMEATIAQRKQYEADVAAMKQYREDNEMGKNSTKNKAAMTSRLPKQFDDELVGDSEIMDMDQVVVEEITEGVPTEEIVCSMELTRMDVTALLFVLTRVFEDYDLEGHEYGESLKSLKEGLEGIE